MAQPRQAAFGLWKYVRRAAQYKMGLETDVAIQIGGQRHVVNTRGEHVENMRFQTMGWNWVPRQHSQIIFAQALLVLA